jgi:hypothetical protein
MYETLYEENQLRERIINLIHQEGISQRAFSISIGKEPNNVYQILMGSRHFPRGFCAAILKAYPKVNRDWLVFGDGTMYYGDKERPDMPKETKPRLPKSGSGGHLEDFYNGDKRELCQERPIVTQFSYYDFSLILKHNRMSPKYERGDELFFKKSTIIEWGNDYLLDTPEGPKFKKILDNGKTVMCISYNKVEYPEFEVPKNMILGYYRCVGVLRVM